MMKRNAASFYAVVFHEFYAEVGGVIAMPCLAANTVEKPAGKEDSPWNSADWKLNSLAESAKLNSFRQSK
jgi:hypothetical protein